MLVFQKVLRTDNEGKSMEQNNKIKSKNNILNNKSSLHGAQENKKIYFVDDSLVIDIECGNIFNEDI